MSRSPSPVSSLDYLNSDFSASEDEYVPVRRQAPAAKKRAPVARGKKAGTLKINLSALARAQEAAAAHPAEGEEYDEGPEVDVAEGFLGGLLASRTTDLSGEDLKQDHAARPLWIDDDGNM
jgi:DNA excision repair protein ERCC-3